MKYYNGYPEEMKVDGQNVTLHDIERTMLSLYWDKMLSEQYKDYLMDKYKEERMHYMDSIFRLTEDNRKRLEEVKRLFANARQRMDDTRKRWVETEQEKRKQGLAAAGVLVLHLEIWNLEDTEEVCYSDEENDLWEVLCGEDRDHAPYWGIMAETVHITDGEQKVYRHQKPGVPKETDENETGFDKDFCRMKEAYRLSWQDMMKISRFRLTVNMQFS